VMGVGDARVMDILALRLQLRVLQRQLSPYKVRFAPGYRALLAALLHRLPRNVLKRLHLVVRPDTVLRWHRDMAACRHARLARSETRSRIVSWGVAAGPGGWLGSFRGAAVARLPLGEVPVGLAGGAGPV
jgi:hypothetical protein